MKSWKNDGIIVKLKGKKVKNHLDLDNCTYNLKDVYGIDTNNFDNVMKHEKIDSFIKE